MGTLRKAKTGTIVKKLDWNLLAINMLDSMFLSQQALSERCKVSQQSISNWKNRTRNPGISAKKMIFELAIKEKIDLGKYEIASPKDTIKKYLEKDNGKELIRIFEHYRKMSRSSRIKLLKHANSLVK